MVCRKCKLNKLPEEFHKSSQFGRRQPCAQCRKKIRKPRVWRCTDCLSTDTLTRYKNYNRCKPCWYKKYRQDDDKKKNGRMKRRYGLTRPEYDRMLLSQNGVCAICERPDIRVVIDHHHTTKKVRGLLCDRCNSILGIWKDDPHIAQRAVDYLS